MNTGGSDDIVDRLCREVHDRYETAAIEAGWETQPRSRVPWDDLPEANKATMRAALEPVAAEIGRLRDGIAQALTELDAEHRPMWVLDRNIGHGSTENQHEAVPGKDPIGCVMCYAEDGSWPCTTRLIADDLRALIEEKHST